MPERKTNGLLRKALIDLLRSDVIHIWPADEIVDYYVMPLIEGHVDAEVVRRHWEFYEDAGPVPFEERFRINEEVNNLMNEEGW